MGAAQVRQAVLGDVDRAPTPAELQQMESLVATAMQQGALGLSTALIYPPGHYATTTELIALAKVASKYGGIYASHMRSEGQSEMAAIDEAIRIGREANLPVEIFHLKVSGKARWGDMPKVVAKLQAARDSGLDIAADMYPYTAGGNRNWPRRCLRGRQMAAWRNCWSVYETPRFAAGSWPIWPTITMIGRTFTWTAAAAVG